MIEKRGVTPIYFEINGEMKSDGIYRLSVDLCFKKKEIELHSHGGKESKVVFGELRDIFESKSTRLYKVLNPWIWYWLTAPAFIIYPSNYNRIPQLPLWLNALAILLFVTFILSALYRRFRHQVILRRKHEGGFFKRNADKIWLLIAGTVFGIILKLIFDVIWKAI